MTKNIIQTGIILAALLLAQARVMPADDFLPGCADYGKTELVHRVRHPLLSESSGIAASRKHQGILYTHNDSGHDPILFAIRTNGDIAGLYVLEDATNLDWEDMAIGPSPSGIGHSVYIGDIGNNRGDRNVVTIYVLPEPDLPREGEANPVTVACAGIELQWPGAPADCEALAVHPLSGAIYLLTKAHFLDQPMLLKADPPFQQDQPRVLSPVLELPMRGDAMVTAMDIHPVGSRLLVRTYRKAYEFIAGTPEEFELRLQEKPRAFPTIGPAGQSEAICYSADGETIYFTAEGKPMPLYHTPCQDQH